MNSIGRACLVAALVVGSAKVTGAHEFFVKPDAMSVKVGDAFAVTILSTHVFMKPEELEDAQDNTACIVNEGKRTPIATTPDPAKLVHTGTVRAPTEKTFILCGVRAGLSFATTAEGSKRGTRKDYPDAKFVRTVQKFSKAIINARVDDDTWSKPIGDRVEIVIKTNPATIKVGDEVPIQVLYNGNPRPTNVWATYDGFSNRHQTFAYYTEMDNADTAFVKITQPGTWIVRAEIVDETKTAEIDRYTGRAVLLFEVK